MDHSHISEFMPHGHCYLWRPSLVLLHVISDALIFLSYAAISLLLFRLRKKVNLPFNGMVLAFSTFIAACGIGHAMDVWTLWNADYYASGVIRAVTALASVTTAIWLFPLSPKIMKMAAAIRLSEKRRTDLETAYAEVEERVQQRTKDLEESHRREKEAREAAEALYESAQQANRMRDDFLASVSHELRTPLGVILGWSDLLIRQQLDGEEQQQALLTIHRNAELQNKLVEDLLDLSRIRSGKLSLHLETVDFGVLVGQVCANLSVAAQAKGIVFEMSLPEGEPLLLQGDPVRLSQVVWNLLSNAIKFTADGGSIRVEAFQDKMMAKVRVVDTGEGIDPAFLPLVFSKFSQEEMKATRRHGGLGLGLSIVKHIVELHGGTIEAHSEGKGKGATFMVGFPMGLRATQNNEPNSSDRASS